MGLLTPTLDDLHHHAHTIGIHLTTHTVGPKGWYNHQTRRISLRKGLSYVQERCTLAHELGHDFYRHAPNPGGHNATKAERLADQYAADLLIDPQQLVELLQFHPTSPAAIAEELEVTQHLLNVMLRNKNPKFIYGVYT